MLTPEQRAATVRSLVCAQESNGCIPWFPGGRWDPWDLVECAIALDASGEHAAARRAYRFLARRQRHDGAWACPIVGGRDDDEVLDSNGASYIAVGAWHHYLCTGDEGSLHEFWPVVERGIDFTIDLQLPWGTIAWARDLDGSPGDHALVTSSSCICISLRCALAMAEEMGTIRPDWELSLTQLQDAVRSGEHFADRSRYSMDWYYPVLSSVLSDEDAGDRMASRWDDFVVEGLGARCVDDRPWITSAETAELAMALMMCGLEDAARDVFGWVQYLRAEDGSYWTGATFPDGRHFPNERSTWSAAATLLADDVLSSQGEFAGILGVLTSEPVT